MTDLLLAVPNVSEGRDVAAVGEIAAAFTDPGATRVLDVHSDPDHHRSVITLAGAPGRLSAALRSGAAEAIARIDLRRALERPGLHPHVGAVDVVPVVYLHAAHRGAACAEALVAGELIGRELGVPVLTYGALAGGRTRAELRRGGVAALDERLRSGELRPDFGPARAHPSAGVTLLAARPPLVAFNVELEPPADAKAAAAIAALLREGGAEGLPGVRAIGLELAAREGRAQVSFNVEDPERVSLAVLVAAVRRHARVHAAELVGLAPKAALEGFPSDVRLPGFEPGRHLLENRLGL
jgi:glutamate formiminotransferase/glutamate formiminotransferase/formiminotetrahydrofolate cyclodeaminase